MADITFLVLQLIVLFVVMVPAVYVGTILALRSYFDDEDPDISDFIRIEDGSDD